MEEVSSNQLIWEIPRYFAGFLWYITSLQYQFQDVQTSAIFFVRSFIIFRLPVLFDSIFSFIAFSEETPQWTFCTDADLKETKIQTSKDRPGSCTCRRFLGPETWTHENPSELMVETFVDLGFLTFFLAGEMT